MGGVPVTAIITSDVRENNVAVPIDGVAPAPHIARRFEAVSVEIMGCTMEKGKRFRLHRRYLLQSRVLKSPQMFVSLYGL